MFFFCEIEPRSGGETPIILSNRLYEMVLKKYPDFIKRLNEHGLLYKWILHAEDDDSVPVGRGWQSTFSTTDRNIAQERFVILFPFSHDIEQSPLFTYITLDV